jgi:WW domain
MTSSNPAALQGWVKSTDPKSGRAFYANHVTRKTQWEAPDGWVDEPPPPSVSRSNNEEEDGPLPSNWEVMHDPTTGKPFYVDHERKVTQWTRPTADAAAAGAAATLRPAAARFAYGNTNNGSSSGVALGHISAAPQQRSYQQEALYYSQPPVSGLGGDVDLSDSLARIEFRVQTVADALRGECPHCDQPFSMSRRAAMSFATRAAITGAPCP